MITSVYKKISLKSLLFYSIIALFIGLYGKIFIFQIFLLQDLSNVYIENHLDAIMQEFAHPFFNINIILSRGLLGDRFFGDIFYWILKPLKLLHITVPDSISYYITFLATGIWDSNIPPGLVAFSISEGGIYGIPIFSFLSGFFLKKLITFFENSVKMTRRNCFVTVLLVYISLSTLTIFAATDPALYIQAEIPIFLLLFFLLSFKKIIVLKI
jgi:hypothetical protein